MSLSNNYPTIRPTLEFDFANVGALDPRITFTRATSATFVNQLGVIQTAAAGVPRFDYDPSTLAARGLLIEEQRTNLVTYSEQFDNAAWTTSASNVSVTANATTSPDGTVTADLSIPSTFNGNHFLRQDIGSLTNGATYTLSVFAKAGGYNRFDLLGGFGSSTGSAAFDLSTGTVTSGTGQIAAFGNGWYRCSTQLVMSGTTLFLLLRSLNNSGAASFAGDGTSGVYYWGAQLEAGSFATSYIPTVASTVTRNADVATVNTLTPWYNQTEGSIFAEASGPLSGTDRIIIEGGTASDFRDFSLNFANLNAQFTPRYVTGTFDVTSPNLTANSTAKLAASYSATSADLAYNGLLATTKTSVTQRIPADRIFLGSRFNSSLFLNGHIRRIAYYPRRLTDAQLQALTS